MAEEDGAGRARGSRLAEARSSYLRGAAEQAIDWHPWGPEPFALAQRTGRPVLLDIGASWCHWCHVMDEGTYSDPEVARLLRQHFVAVKVDRDEHPEVDRRYQRQVGALSGEGGWPLTGFLTPDGEVFLGGTYFPPTDGHGRPGFRRVLQEVARLWREEPDRLRAQAGQVQAALQRMREARAGSTGLDAFVASVRAEIHGSYDPAHGGFGGAPKFPHPTAIAFLLWDAYANQHPASADRAAETLRRMADGGVYDQLGGGFHRYSVDEGWHVPHFEKMGVDNAALLSAYTEGVQRFADPRFEEIVRGTVAWTRGTLGDPRGGWGASQDADNAPGDDGSYFTWSKAQLREVVDGDAGRLVSRYFGVGTDGRMPHDPDQNVLYRLLPLTEAADGLRLPDGPEATLRSAIGALTAARARRPTPTVDRALYADINGRFLAAFARAGAVLDDRQILADARRSADRWLATAFAPERGVAHRLDDDEASGYGLLEDQVAFAAGLIELGAVTAEPKYATAASTLLSLVDREFRGEDGLLRDVSPRLYDGPAIGAIGQASYPLEDSPHLSANAGAALAFLRLGAILHDDRWVEKARALLAPIAARIGGAGLFAAGSALAAGLLGTPPASVVVEGSGPAAQELLRAARRAWHPNVVVFAGRPPPPFSLPTEVANGTGSEVRALVCFGTACAPPVTDPAALSPLLAGGSASPGA